MSGEGVQPRQRVRLLIVDDSPVFAEMTRAIVEREPGFTVVGVARDGAEAVDLANRLRPDLITMDVCMPVMDGLEAIRKIMADCPTPTLVLSADPRGASGELAFEALRCGAVDLMTKPTRWPASPAEQKAFCEHLRFLATIAVVPHIAARRETWRQRRPHVALRSGAAPRVLAIVASTGGPAAIAALLRAMPRACGLEIAVVQHLAPGFSTTFCAWLAAATGRQVRLASDGAPLAPDVVVVAPSSAHLTIGSHGRVHLDDGPPLEGHRPSGTKLLTSVAAVYGRAAIGVVLTGMGRDGADGLLAMRRAGAITIAQDEATSVVDGMPGAARSSGAALHVLPIGPMAEAIGALAGTGSA